MQRSVLLTSFTTWKPHHVSNSSDDLLERIGKSHIGPLHYLRRLPVDFRLAPKKVLARFDALRPDILICCGMAEGRERLSIESRAVLEGETLETRVDLQSLTRGLPMTEISHDAGGFVCNSLYFEALRHLHGQPRQHHCIFAHVPVLTGENAGQVESDFLVVVARLSQA